MNRHDFLVEIGAEEMPPKSLATLGEAFRNGVVNFTGVLEPLVAEVVGAVVGGSGLRHQPPEPLTHR